jgi:hypothetical protein
MLIIAAALELQDPRERPARTCERADHGSLIALIKS